MAMTRSGLRVTQRPAILLFDVDGQVVLTAVGRFLPVFAAQNLPRRAETALRTLGMMPDLHPVPDEPER